MVGSGEEECAHAVFDDGIAVVAVVVVAAAAGSTVDSKNHRTKKVAGSTVDSKNHRTKKVRTDGGLGLMTDC